MFIDIQLIELIKLWAREVRGTGSQKLYQMVLDLALSDERCIAPPRVKGRVRFKVRVS